MLQLVPKPDAVLSTPAVSPVQHHGQQFVLGQVNHRLRTQVMHAGTSLSLEKKIQELRRQALHTVSMSSCKWYGWDWDSFSGAWKLRQVVATRIWTNIQQSAATAELEHLATTVLMRCARQCDVRGSICLTHYMPCKSHVKVCQQYVTCSTHNTLF